MSSLVKAGKIAALFKRFRVSDIRRAVRNRGLSGVVVHGARRLGTAWNLLLFGPDMIRINPLSYLCHHACAVCWLQQLDATERKEREERERRGMMRLPDYLKFFSSLPPGVREINIVGGGEPLMHPDITGIMRAVKRHGLKGSLITNGTLLAPRIAREMVAMRWDELRVSISAGDPETFRRVQGVDGFHRVVDNVRYYDMLRRNQRLRKTCGIVAFHVLQRGNLDSVENLFRVSEAIGADRMELDLVFPTHPSFELTRDELSALSESLKACAETYAIPFNKEEILSQLARFSTAAAAPGGAFVPAGFCSVGFDQTFIDSLGNVFPCCFSDEKMGNVREQPFREIWRSEVYKDFRLRLIKGRFARYCIEYRCSLPGVLHE